MMFFDKTGKKFAVVRFTCELDITMFGEEHPITGKKSSVTQATFQKEGC